MSKINIRISDEEIKEMCPEKKTEIISTIESLIKNLDNILSVLTRNDNNEEFSKRIEAIKKQKLEMSSLIKKLLG